MNPFRRAGKLFEETKRTFVDGENAANVCLSCEETVSDDHEYCPHCGEGTVAPLE